MDKCGKSTKKSDHSAAVYDTSVSGNVINNQISPSEAKRDPEALATVHENEPLLPKQPVDGKPYMRGGILDLSLRNAPRLPRGVELKEVGNEEDDEDDNDGKPISNDSRDDEACSDEECTHDHHRAVKTMLKDNMNQYWIDQYQYNNDHGAVQGNSNNTANGHNHHEDSSNNDSVHEHESDDTSHAVTDEDSQKKTSGSFVSIMPTVVFDYATTTASGAWALISGSNSNAADANSTKKIAKRNDLLLHKAPLLHRKRTPPNDVYAMI
jgi:hypothetical protein